MHPLRWLPRYSHSKAHSFHYHIFPLKPFGRASQVTCPRGHPLKLLDTGNSYNCDLCRTRGLSGARLCCKQGACDHDVCPQCAAAVGGPVCTD